MASYVGHLWCASTLAVGYAAAGYGYLHIDWGPVALGAGLTAVGSLLPDLDSDSGVPVRELFGLVAAVVPVLLFKRVEGLGYTPEQTFALLGGLYLAVRFGAAYVFRRLTVHRGMFHSVPAMLIAGLAVFLLYHNPDRLVRVYLALGTMIGFLSHLVLDEMYAVNFMGLHFKRNRYAGSALKFFSPSWVATAATYGVLGVLGWLAWAEWGA